MQSVVDWDLQAPPDLETHILLPTLLWHFLAVANLDLPFIHHLHLLHQRCIPDYLTFSLRREHHVGLCRYLLYPNFPPPLGGGVTPPHKDADFALCGAQCASALRDVAAEKGRTQANMTEPSHAR